MRCLVEHDEVGGVAGAEEAAVGQFPGRGVVEGQHAHGLFEGELLPLRTQ